MKRHGFRKQLRTRYVLKHSNGICFRGANKPHIFPSVALKSSVANWETRTPTGRQMMSILYCKFHHVLSTSPIEKHSLTFIASMKRLRISAASSFISSLPLDWLELVPCRGIVASVVMTSNGCFWVAWAKKYWWTSMAGWWKSVPTKGTFHCCHKKKEILDFEQT